MDAVIVLRRVCAWCKAVAAEGTPGAPTTHGACDACFTRLMAEPIGVSA